MSILLILLIAALVGTDVLGLDSSLAPGVTIKNALLYLIIAVLVLRVAIKRDLRVELPGVQMCFIVIIFYAVVTCVLAAFVLQYPGYEFLEAAINLKRNMFDPALFFFVVFYGLRNTGEAMQVVRAFIGIFSVANLLTITDTLNVTNFSTVIGTGGEEAGRVFGFFGHANESAALLSFLMPIAIALAVSASGLPRLLWIVAALLAAIVFMLNGSRGGLVGVLVGGVWAALLCRRHLHLAKLTITTGVIVALVIVPIVSWQFGDVFLERVQRDVSGTTIAAASSGRGDLWANAVGRMMSAPVTLVTGYGWDAYENMRFRYAPHNHYLWLWFNLGLVGLLAFVLLLRRLISAARAVAEVADRDIKLLMLGFTFGILSLAVSIFFTNLITPWLYVWALVGAIMRIAVEQLEHGAQKIAAGSGSIIAAPKQYGWSRGDGTSGGIKEQSL